MTRGTLDIERLTELCGAMCDGVLDADGAAELDGLLAADPLARRMYGILVDTHLDLESAGADAAAEPIVMTAAPARTAWHGYAMAATVVLGAAILGIVAYVMSNASEPTPEARPVAVVLDTVGVSWASDRVRVGDEVPPSVIRIDRGRVVLSMHSGAVVSMVGPAELTLRSRNGCAVSYGQVTARVPEEAIGFALATPRFKVVDLGTEFGVRVGADGSGEVRVFDGSVAVDDGRKWIVTAGSGRRYTASGSGAAFAVTSRWRDDATRVVRYSFDGAAHDPIVDSGYGFEDGPFDIETLGRRVPTRRVEGVFGEAMSLRPGEVYETGFAGIGGGAERTVAFWVRVPTDARDDQSQAVVSWGDGKVGGAAWQIGWDKWNAKHKGALRVFAGDKGVVAGTTDLRDGKWHHVAVVLERADEPDVAKHVRLYVDGEAEAVGRAQAVAIDTATSGDASPVRIGWDTQGGRAGFRGAIDELVITDRAMTAEQIATLLGANELEHTNGD